MEPRSMFKTSSRRSSNSALPPSSAPTHSTDNVPEPTHMTYIPTTSFASFTSPASSTDVVFPCMLPTSTFASKDYLLDRIFKSTSTDTIQSSLSAYDILQAPASALYPLLTLVLCAIEQRHAVGSSEFVALARAVRDRCAVSRVLKLRLLFAVHHEAAFPKWFLRTTLRTEAYAIARQRLRAELQRSEAQQIQDANGTDERGDREQDRKNKKYKVSRAFCDYVAQVVFAPSRVKLWVSHANTPHGGGDGGGIANGVFSTNGLLQNIQSTPGVLDIYHAKLVMSKMIEYGLATGTGNNPNINTKTNMTTNTNIIKDKTTTNTNTITNTNTNTNTNTKTNMTNEIAEKEDFIDSFRNIRQQISVNDDENFRTSLISHIKDAEAVTFRNNNGKLISSNSQGVPKATTSNYSTSSSSISNSSTTAKGANKTNTNGIQSITIVIPVDKVDLQSVDFWTESVYEKPFVPKVTFGFRAVTHPVRMHSVERDKIRSRNRNRYSQRHYYQSEDDTGNNFNEVEEDHSGDDDSHDDDDMRSPFDHRHNSGSNCSTSSSSQDGGHEEREEKEERKLKQCVVDRVHITKVFSSLSRPCLVDLESFAEGSTFDISPTSSPSSVTSVKPNLLLKKGDNLMQDHCVSVMFQVFNYIWRHSSAYRPTEPKPHCFAYEVVPTSVSNGFIEGLSSITPLSDVDWAVWFGRASASSHPQAMENFVLSAAGALVGGYVLGATDRHWGNMVLKDDCTLLHIDFSFILGDAPPIDAPRISIPPPMEKVFKGAKTSDGKYSLWDALVDATLKAFIVLRANHTVILRAAQLLFTHGGFEEQHIAQFLRSKSSLALDRDDDDAVAYLRKKIISSSKHFKTQVKRFVHDVVNPAWYAVVQKGPLPADGVMKLVNRYQADNASTQQLTKMACIKREQLNKQQQKHNSNESTIIDE